MKKKSKFTQDIFIGIITGIISTLVISWLITPLTNLIFPKILTFLENISMPFVDGLYRLASTITIERVGLLNLTFSATCVLFLVIFSFQFLFSAKGEVQDQLDEINALISPSSKMSEEEIMQSIKEDKRYLLKKRKKYKKLFLAYLISLILVCFTILLSEMTEIYASSLSTNTRANIEIVAPYISDQEYKQLKSDFFTIKIKSDYDNLQNTLNMISDEHSLDLKE